MSGAAKVVSIASVIHATPSRVPRGATRTHTSYRPQIGNQATSVVEKPLKNPRETGASSCAVRCLERPTPSGSRTMRSRLPSHRAASRRETALIADLVKAVLLCFFHPYQASFLLAVELRSAGSARSSAMGHPPSPAP